MKKILIVAALLGVAGTLMIPKRAAQVRPLKYDPIAAREGAAAAAKLAAVKIEAPASDLSRLTRGELEAKIGEIDAEIERRHLVERSNRGELGSAELSDLRRLLDQRNRYTVRKIDLDLDQG